jgi:hypothetical protein
VDGEDAVTGAGCVFGDYLALEFGAGPESLDAARRHDGRARLIGHGINWSERPGKHQDRNDYTNEIPGRPA